MVAQLARTLGEQAARAAEVEYPRRREINPRTFGLDEYIFDALRAGAAGFLVKDPDAAELIRAVRVIAAGRRCLCPGWPS